MPLHCFRKTVCAGWGIRRFIRSSLSVSIPNFVSLISLQIPFLVKCWRKKLLPEKLLIRLPCRFLGERGKLYWLPLPAFTNYGVLDGKNAAYLFRILSQMGGFPIVRTEGYMKETAQVQMSPFRYFLSQPPLRWALYLSMVSILLFMIFTARRKQRAIPVIREPENKSLEFAELIGTLYYQKKDHADLVRKKYLYFAEELRREIQVDVEEVAEDERSLAGLPGRRVWKRGK